MIGSKDHQGLPLMAEMASRGWVCAAVNYPLSPKAKWPAHLVALKQAVAWLRAEAPSFGGNPDFLAVTGGSAGGHLADHARAHRERPAVPAGVRGRRHLGGGLRAVLRRLRLRRRDRDQAVTARVQSPLSAMILGRNAQFPRDYLAASPLARLHADAPPFLVVHGTNDSLIPVAEAREFVRRLRDVSSNPVGYAELRGAQHAFEIFHSIRTERVISGAAAFLDAARLGTLRPAGEAPDAPVPTEPETDQRPPSGLTPAGGSPAA